MKKKKFLSSILGVALVGVIAGCGGSDNNDNTLNDTAEGSEVNNAGAEAEEEAVTIRLHHWYNIEQDNWNEVVAAFEEEHPHINIEMNSPENNDANETVQQMDLAAASGDQLDVMMINNAQDYSQRVGQGMFEPLNGFIEEDGYEYEDEYSVNTAVDGDYYALPGKFNGFFVMLNEDALDEAGLEVPEEWTWDEYMDYAEQLSEGEGADRRYGTFFHTWLDYMKLAVFNQPEDSNIIKDDGVTSNIDSEHIRKSLEIRERGHEDNSATPYADTISLDLNYRDQFFGESAAMIMTGTWMINDTSGTDEYPPFNLAYAPYPKAAEGDDSTSPSGADFLAIYSGSDYKEEAYEFIRWYTTEGITMQGKYLPDPQAVDIEEVVNNLLEEADDLDQEGVNVDSLIHTLETQEPAALNIPPAYIGEAESAYENEVESFLLGDQDLDTTIENAHEAVQNVIDQNAE
ncbi:ABC transporter substrate-binding protein [Alkalicoccus daliensis]|uniref:Multiple sugar transport system substrate-binding protein n=1 Tax=Alkalicoccus daliensis TaxID=745820 RepID=A0A1H0GAB2_9BACI|nr:extracellular solute-binding protein [Alkalicoccus daliensis]SDO03823.1 multiple sugar transport system substrate-binding protein [Alkalicoccus daliensis]